MQFGLYLVFITLAYLRWQTLLPDTHFMRAVLVVLAISALFSWRKTSDTRIVAVMLGFLALIFALIPFARFTMAAYYTFTGMSKVITIALIGFIVVDSWKKLAALAAVLLASHAYLALTTLATYHSLSVGAELARIGAVGTAKGSWLGDANDFALALNIVLPLAVILFLNQRGLRKVALLGCAALLIAGIMSTYSRGGFITMVGAMAGVWFLRGRRVWVGVVVTVAVVGLLVLAPQSYLSRLGTIETLDKNDTGYGRLQLWKAGLLMLKDHPLTGVGPGSYHGAFGSSYMSMVERNSNKWHVAHSAYVTVAAEMGLPGIILYCYLIYLAFKENLATRRLLRERGSPSWQVALCEGFTCSLIAYVVGSTFLSVAYYDHVYFLAALSAAMAATVRAELAPARQLAEQPLAAQAAA